MKNATRQPQLLRLACRGLQTRYHAPPCLSESVEDSVTISRALLPLTASRRPSLNSACVESSAIPPLILDLPSRLISHYVLILSPVLLSTRTARGKVLVSLVLALSVLLGLLQLLLGQLARADCGGRLLREQRASGSIDAGRLEKPEALKARSPKIASRKGQRSHRFSKPRAKNAAPVTKLVVLLSFPTTCTNLQRRRVATSETS